MVDIDQKVIEASKKHLPGFHRNCWNDKRLKLICDDAKKILLEDEKKYDIIFLGNINFFFIIIFYF